MRERELKLAIGDTFVLPQLASPSLGVAEVRDLPELFLGSVYYDTPDLRLARHGVTLRYRVGDEGGPHWTLKLPVIGMDAAEREELRFDEGPSSVPQRARALVLAWVRGAQLAPAAALNTRRRRWLLLADGGAEIAELASDEVSVLDGETTVGRFRELELESRGPGLAVLAPIAARLQEAGAAPAAPVPKVVRALGPRAAAPPDVVVPFAGPRDPVGATVQAAIATSVLRLQQHDPLARLEDAEGIHQMRVATRRLRSDLRTFAAYLDRDWAAALGGELRWLGGLLGAVRDADVRLEHLAATAGDLRPEIDPLTEAIGRERAEAIARLATALEESRYLDLLERLVEAAREPMLRRAANAEAAPELRPLLKAQWKRLRGRARRLAESDPDTAYHRVRIATKRLRYAAEAIGPALGANARAAAALAGRAAQVQDLLGELQDVAGLHATIARVLAEREGDAGFAHAAGRLVEREERIRQERRAAYPAAWKALRRSAERWLTR